MKIVKIVRRDIDIGDPNQMLLLGVTLKMGDILEYIR